MGEFNPLNINGYSFDELKDFLLSEKVTFQQMQQLGLNWKMLRHSISAVSVGHL